MVPLLDQFLELLFRVMQARAHGSQFASHNVSDLVIAHVLDKAEQQDLAVLRVQLPQRLMDFLCILGTERDIGDIRKIQLCKVTRAIFYSTQVPIRAIPRQPINPR